MMELQRRTFAAHLLIDAVKMLFAPLDPALHTGLLQRAAQVVGDIPDELLLIAARLLQRLFNDAVAPGYSALNPSSSSSDLIEWMPSRLAIGA